MISVNVYDVFAAGVAGSRHAAYAALAAAHMRIAAAKTQRSWIGALPI